MTAHSPEAQGSPQPSLCSEHQGQMRLLLVGGETVQRGSPGSANLRPRVLTLSPLMGFEPGPGCQPVGRVGRLERQWAGSHPGLRPQTYLLLWSEEVSSLRRSLAPPTWELWRGGLRGGHWKGVDPGTGSKHSQGQQPRPCVESLPRVPLAQCPPQAQSSSAPQTPPAGTSAPQDPQTGPSPSPPLACPPGSSPSCDQSFRLSDPRGHALS